MLNQLALKDILPNEDDLRIINRLSCSLQYYADLSQADVFIDCWLPEKEEVIVVAEAHPTNGKSLYTQPVKGKVALQINEPGVFFSLKSGKEVIGSRGISQEGVNIQQNVVPIKNTHGKTIAVMITEQDITEKVKQEKNVEILKETTEQLGETILKYVFAQAEIPSLINEGFIIFDHNGAISYANDRVYDILKMKSQSFIGKALEDVSLGFIMTENFPNASDVFFDEIRYGDTYIQLKVVSLQQNQQVVGGILLVRDLSEIKEKEKQLIIKSAVIKEIHHRVKNNLQTIASLLRLQLRRSNSEEVEKVFRDSINRITSISIIHEVLSQDGLHSVDCKEIFDYVSRGIVSSMQRNDQSIGVNISGDSVHLTSKQASSLALIINELVQNAMSHAFSGKSEGLIWISIQQKNNFVMIELTDNGVGFNFDDHKNNKQHLGLEICKTLVLEDLDGLIDFINHGNGTKVSITFPVSEEEN